MSLTLCAACAAAPATPAPRGEPGTLPAASDDMVDWASALDSEATALQAAHAGAEVRIVVLNASDASVLATHGDVTVPTPTGSTIKPITVFAALAAGLDPGLKIDASAPLEIDGKTIVDARNNGVLSLPQAIAKSSNIAVARAVQTVSWQDVYARVSAMVHLPDPEGMTLWDAVGQLDGFVTEVPMKTLVEAYAAMGVDPEHGAAVLDMLRLAVSDEGTGERAAVEGLEVLGKTGTEADENGNTAVFVGRVQGEGQDVWIGINVRGVGKDAYGGSVAAPAFAHIAQAALKPREAAPTR